MAIRLLPRTARAKAAPITLAVPTDGRGFAALRLCLGISQGALARSLGWHASTVAHREQSSEPLSYDKRSYWLAGLQRASAQRYCDLRKAGLHLSDLPGAGLGALLTALQASAPSGSPSGLGGDAA